MKENERRFLIKDIIRLSKLPSILINNILKDNEIYLSKRILCYILAQQINIQISNDKELSNLRGYVGELEDYTLQQLINFTDIHSISIDPSDLKFRIWTVIFNNLEELNIYDEAIDNALKDVEYRFEYAKDMFLVLTQFIDDQNDIDGQPFIVARESLLRFSTREEILSLGKFLAIRVPKKMSKDMFIENIISKLEDDSTELKEELSGFTLPELEEYSEENFLAISAKLNVRDIIDYILNEYIAPSQIISKIEYINHLQIPSLNSGFIEDENRNIEDLKPKNVLDESLYEMISQIIRGEDYSKNEEISEEHSKVELDKVINTILNGYNRQKPEQVENPVETDGPQKVSEVNSARESELLDRISQLEKQMSEPIEPKYTREDSGKDIQKELLRKFEELEKKLMSDKETIEPKADIPLEDSMLIKKINELEEKLSQISTPKLENDNNKSKLLERLNNLENKMDNSASVENDYNESSDDFYDNNYVYQIDEEDNEIYELSYELKPEYESEPESYLEQEESTLLVEPEEIQQDIESLQLNDIKEEIEEDEEGTNDESIGDFIEEIHSAEGLENLKVRRKKTILPVKVFWKSLVIWALINAVGITIFLINDLI